MRVTEDISEQVDWTELALMAGAKAGARFAIDDGGTNRLLGGPVGGLHLWPFQKDKQLVLMTPQMFGQALIGGVSLLLGQQAAHASLQKPLDDPKRVPKRPKRVPADFILMI